MVVNAHICVCGLCGNTFRWNLHVGFNLCGKKIQDSKNPEFGIMNALLFTAVWFKTNQMQKQLIPALCDNCTQNPYFIYGFNMNQQHVIYGFNMNQQHV